MSLDSIKLRDILEKYIWYHITIRLFFTNLKWWFFLMTRNCTILRKTPSICLQQY